MRLRVCVPIYPRNLLCKTARTITYISFTINKSRDDRDGYFTVHQDV
jgi:hypothetical protein